MAKVISTADVDHKPKYQDDKFVPNKNENNDHVKMADPMKTCMTRTIVPNKRPIDHRDVKRFVNRVKKAKAEELVVNKSTKKKKGTDDKTEK